jgi:aspartate aminotransferase
LSYAPNQITVGTGGKQVLYNALMATLNPGDEVIIPAPYWVSYPEMVALGGGTPVEIVGPQDQGFKINAAALEAAITPKTKWLLLNSPSNPTGAGYTFAELRALADVLLKYPHVWIMTDDMYEHLVFDDFKFVTIAEVEPKLYDRTLTVNGVSKAYAMTGWRIGYAGGPASDQGNGHDPVAVDVEPLLRLAVGGSRGAERHAGLHPEERRTVQEAPRPRRLDAEPGKRHRLPERRKARSTCSHPAPARSARRPAGGRLLETDVDFVTALLEEEGVAVVQGSAFGLAPYFRISYATSTEALEEACTRIQRFTASLS